MTATLHDVAAKAGVSAITVSRALNNTGHVSADTRQRILAAVSDLNYVPNALASSLRSQRTQLLAMIGGPATVSTADDRVLGYVAALQEARMAPDPQLVLRGPYRQAWGAAAMEDLLSRGRRPDAVFAANNVIALGVMEALQAHAL